MIITCPNCSTQNSPIVVKCVKCGSFIQARVPNLNLFETWWQVIEKPIKTFYRICLSEQKNYVYTLFAIMGIGLAFTSFWFLNIGNRYANLLNILLLGIVLGPPIGIILMSFLALVLFVVSRFIFRIKCHFRNIVSIVAYSMTPIVLSSIFILPVKLIIFGLFFFTNNPSPVDLKPMPYYVLISLDGLCVIYSLILFLLGIKVATNGKLLKSSLIALISIAIFIYTIYFLLLISKKVLYI